jgi:hypothetical protein
VGGAAEITGPLALSDQLSVGGATQLEGTTSLGGELSVAGPSTINNTLGVSGATTLGSGLQVSGETQLASTLGVTGATRLQSGLTVAGASTFNDEATFTAATNFNKNVEISGKLNLADQIIVDKTAQLNSDLDVSGDASIDGLISAGDLEIDGKPINDLLNQSAWKEKNENLLYDGNVGIGTDKVGDEFKLDVNGHIRATEIVVSADWSDFVFEEDYQLMALNEVEAYIKENKHLPDIPSESVIANSGVSVGEINAKLLQKIEELTLYVIKQDKAIKKMETIYSRKDKIIDLQKKLIKKLENKLENKKNN